MSSDLRIDVLVPPGMARRAENVDISKAKAPVFSVLALGILAGAFIALGAVFATTVSVSTPGSWPFDVSKLLADLVFSLGLILVVVGGAELLTGIDYPPKHRGRSGCIYYSQCVRTFPLTEKESHRRKNNDACKETPAHLTES